MNAKKGKSGVSWSFNFTCKSISVLIIVLCYPLFVLADWTEFASSQNGDRYWYDKSSVQKIDDSVRLWQRIRYGKQISTGDWSSLLYLEILCSKDQVRLLEWRRFADKNWSQKKGVEEGQFEAFSIPKNTALQKLADIGCK